MSLRLDCSKRNYELEMIKHMCKTKPVRDHPLILSDGAGAAAANRGGISAFGAQKRGFVLESR